MKRRTALRAGASLALGAGIAGCTSDSAESTDQDSDGDGVPDEHDYAPRDPDVKVQSDVQRADATPTEESRTIVNTATPEPTETPTPTPVPTSSPTPTPVPTSSPTPTEAPKNEIHVETEQVENRTHHFVRYSLREVEVQVYSSLLDNSYPDGGKVLYVLSEYPSKANPDGRVIERHRSDLIANPTQSDVRITTSFGSPATPDSPFFISAVLIPAGVDVAELEDGEGETLAQSDRLELDGGKLVHSPLDVEPDSIETDSYDRTTVDGAYLLHFYGETYGTSWTASMVAYKSFYARSLFRDRHDDFTKYVSEALSGGYADTLGTILSTQASKRGMTEPRMQLEMLIDFVQNLPYVPDDVSTGFDEYPKSMVETLIEAGGDCEDTAIMLAALIRSEAFGYGAVLLFLPGHAAVGVKGGDEVSGRYYDYQGARYYYIETTGENWDVGEMPEEYQNKSAQIYSV